MQWHCCSLKSAVGAAGVGSSDLRQRRYSRRKSLAKSMSFAVICSACVGWLGCCQDCGSSCSAAGSLAFI